MIVLEYLIGNCRNKETFNLKYCILIKKAKFIFEFVLYLKRYKNSTKIEFYKIDKNGEISKFYY